MREKRGLKEKAFPLSVLGLIVFALLIPVFGYASVEPVAAGPAGGMIINHACTNIGTIPETAVAQAKSQLHIAYGHTSHGSQIPDGMTGLVGFMNGLGHTADLYAWNDGGAGGALDLRDYAMPGDLGNPDRVTWAQETRDYLGAPDASGHGSLHPEVNVIMWSWCGQVDGSESDISNYLSLMSGLEAGYPAVNFVYMTGHLDGTGAAGNVNTRNQQIRDYCTANNKVLYDFADIESYDPDGAVNYMQLMANDNCDYDSDGNGSLDRNWAVDWQNSHVQDVDWYNCTAAHSQPLNGNRKAYAAWWMFARLAGWGQPTPPMTHSITVAQGEHGTITPAGTGGVVTVADGASQTFTITPDTNYQVTNVLVDFASVGAVTTYTFPNVTANHAITAVFDIAPTPTLTPTITSVYPGSGPPGTSVTITGDNFGNTRGSSERSREAASYVSFNGVQATVYTKWSDTEIVCTVPDGATPGPVTVVVNGQSSGGNKTFTVASPTWYLAEGTNAWGFSTLITIENPNKSEVPCAVTYMTGAGPKQIPDITLPPESQMVINPLGDLGATDFSTKVESRDPIKTIAVDRRMTWAGKGAASPEGHASVGVTSPEKTWYLPEGSSAWGFETWLLIQNPNNAEATCKVTYMTEGKAPIPVEHKVPANSRKSYSMTEDIKMEADASIKVDADIPVIPERAMYRNNRREGHDSIGTTTPANDYYLAEGTTDWGFTTYVLIQNPNNDAANVTITYMTGEGPKEMAPISIPGNSRKTIRVNDYVQKKDLSTRVHSDKPIIAERAMYWGAEKPPWEACHDSIGMSQPHTTFYLPDGETSNGYETWTLVQNPNSEEVEIEVSYLTPSGKNNVVFADKVPANSRKTYSLANVIPSGRAAIMVTCKTSGKKIMVERSMYWNSRGAGTDTIGGYSD